MILKRDNVERIAEGNKARELIENGFVALSGFLPEPEAAEAVDYSAMPVRELRKLAKSLGIEGANALTKKELVEVLNDGAR